jgi:hypothetical protein
MDFQHEVVEHNADRFLEWIQKRGGVAVWESINLSNPGASWSTPAQTEDGQPMKKPTWQAANEPAKIITDPAQIAVLTVKEVKRFHVAVEHREGFQLVVSDGGSRRIRSEVAKAGEGAYHVFDYEAYNNAVIMAPVGKVSLAEWAKVRKPT